MSAIASKLLDRLRPLRRYGLVNKAYMILRTIKREVVSMPVVRNPLVPDYIYGARVRDEDVPWFEQQFYKHTDTYDADVRETKERYEYARRIGYGFFADLKASVIARSAAHARYKNEIVSLGGKGYAWPYIPSKINAKSIVYAFGIGTDISFEEALAETHKCEVKCFDPTPQAMEFALKIARKNPLISFYPYGLFSRDTIVRFYKPKDAGLGSLSAANLHYSDIYLEAPVLRISTMMKQFGHERIDLLKMDIEGAEYDAIDDLLFSGIVVDQLAIEFDQPIPPWRTTRVIGKLAAAGYRLTIVDGLNTLFVHDRLMA